MIGLTCFADTNDAFFDAEIDRSGRTNEETGDSESRRHSSAVAEGDLRDLRSSLNKKNSAGDGHGVAADGG